MRRLRLKAYAKINLGLAVLGRRPDGYHELRTIYQSVSLADNVEVSRLPGSGQIQLEASGYLVPGGEQNLAVRAARVIQEAMRFRSSLRITLHKRIPPGSGLGGASSDAAAVLGAILSLSGKRLAPERLLHLAAGLGSDVPFFLVGGRAVGVGRGEEVYPLPDLPRQSVVVVFPGEGMSTPEAYRLLRPRLTASATHPTIELFCARAVTGGSPPANDFEPLLLKRLPQLAAAKKILLRHGAASASLTGSGSALYGLFDDAGKARRAAQALRSSEGKVFLARTISRREFMQPAALASPA